MTEFANEDPTGLEDPLLRQLFSGICDSIGVDPAELSPLYTQLSLAALHEAETLVLTYIVSQLKNSLTPRDERGRKAKNTEAKKI